MFSEISAHQLTMIAQVVPAGPFKLLTMYMSKSKDGAYAIYPTAAWCAHQLEVSVRTIHRWKARLEALLSDVGLLTIKRRKVEADYNLPNLIRIAPLRRLAKWAWARIRRKGDTPVTETPTPIYKKTLPHRKLFEPANSVARLAVREAFGMTDDLLASIPDAPKWLRKKAGVP